MVLSGTKMTSSIASIKNTNQGGGNKKAGVPPTVGMDSWTHVAHTQSGNGLMSLVNMRTNRFKRFPSMNLPVGMGTRIRMR